LSITPTLAPPYIDVTPYLFNGKTYLAFVNADNAKPLGYEQAEQMGHVVHQTMKNSTVGYQFMLAQSGRIYFSRASGKLKLDSDPSLERDMDLPHAAQYRQRQQDGHGDDCAQAGRTGEACPQR
jgi:hypothetical protein